MIKLSPINDIECVCDWKDKDLKPVFENQEKITGPTLFFPNFIISSAKGAGKTVCAVNLIRKLATNKTKIVIFSQTFRDGDDKDAFADIEEKYPGMVEVYSKIKTKEGDILQRKIEDAKDRFGIIKSKNYDHTFPNYIFLFDDLAAEDLRDATMEYLYRTNRHIGAITILIEHRLNSGASTLIRDNTDIVIVFAGLSSDQINQVHDMVNIPNVTKKDFTKIYHKATEGSRNFLFINKTTKEMRQNFKNLISYQ